jgi:hypothetical protein
MDICLKVCATSADPDQHASPCSQIRRSPLFGFSVRNSFMNLKVNSGDPDQSAHTFKHMSMWERVKYVVMLKPYPGEFIYAVLLSFGSV